MFYVTQQQSKKNCKLLYQFYELLCYQFMIADYTYLSFQVSEPVELVHYIMKDLEATRKQKTRFLLRLLPIEATCKVCYAKTQYIQCSNYHCIIKVHVRFNYVCYNCSLYGQMYLIRGAQIPGTRSLWQLNFIQQHLVLLYPTYGTCFTSPF